MTQAGRLARLHTRWLQGGREGYIHVGNRSFSLSEQTQRQWDANKNIFKEPNVTQGGGKVFIGLFVNI